MASISQYIYNGNLQHGETDKIDSVLTVLALTLQCARMYTSSTQFCAVLGPLVIMCKFPLEITNYTFNVFQ